MPFSSHPLNWGLHLIFWFCKDGTWKPPNMALYEISLKEAEQNLKMLLKITKTIVL